MERRSHLRPVHKLISKVSRLVTVTHPKRRRGICHETSSPTTESDIDSSVFTMAEEEDFASLAWSDRFTHKVRHPACLTSSPLQMARTEAAAAMESQEGGL